MENPTARVAVELVQEWDGDKIRLKVLCKFPGEPTAVKGNAAALDTE